ncbi:deoxyribose-phosphate aldolase [Syntrophomonas erecta]
MLASYLDSTNLKPEATSHDIEKLCRDAALYHTAAVCVHPYRVEGAVEQLKETGVKVCTVIGFPLGANQIETKQYEAGIALHDGAAELDMVLNQGAIKDKDYNLIKREIDSLVALKKKHPFSLKVIVETALLGQQELANLTKLVSDSGADYIKTSTGFSTRGVSLGDIDIINANRFNGLKIKASGGIKTLNFALQLIEAGVERIGTSSALQLIEEFKKWEGYRGDSFYV